MKKLPITKREDLQDIFHLIESNPTVNVVFGIINGIAMCSQTFFVKQNICAARQVFIQNLQRRKELVMNLEKFIDYVDKIDGGWESFMEERPNVQISR